MGMGGIGSYLEAWMDSDEQQKDKVFQMMKDAVGMQSTMTGTRAVTQQMRLAEAGEQRTQQMFPTAQAQQETTLQQSRVGLAGEQRGEAEARAANEAVAARYDETLGVLTALLDAGMKEEAMRYLEQRREREMPTAMAERDIAQLGAETGEAELREAGARAELGEEVPGAAATSKKRVMEAAGEEAMTAGEITKERREAGVAPALAGREVAEAGAATAKAEMDKMISDRLAAGDYADLIAKAETTIAGLKDDRYWQELKLLQAQTRVAEGEAEMAETPGLKELSPILKVIRSHLGEDEFVKWLLKREEIKSGMKPSQMDYNDRIDKVETNIASIRQRLNSGMSMMEYLAGAAKGDKTLQDMFEERGAEKLDEDEVVALLRAHARVLKQGLYEDHGVIYDAVKYRGLAGITIENEDITDAINAIEANQGLQGYQGDMIRQWPAGGMGAVDQARVLTAVEAIVGYRDPDGRPTHPANWTQNLEANKDKLMTQVLPHIPPWTEAEYNAALTILRVLQTKILTPESIPGLKGLKQESEFPEK